MIMKESIQELIKKILDGTELVLAVDKYSLEESLENADCKIRCEVHDAHTGEKQIIEGRGVGIVDAFLHGMVARYAGTFPSLKSIRFADFSIKANLDTGRGIRSDSNAIVTLRVANSEGREIAFTHTSPSITRSSIQVVLQAVEFFINSERAFIDVYRALQHARSAGNRPDSVQLYTVQLATLVEATSYSEVIEQIKKSELQ